MLDVDGNTDNICLTDVIISDNDGEGLDVTVKNCNTINISGTVDNSIERIISLVKSEIDNFRIGLKHNGKEIFKPEPFVAPKYELFVPLYGDRIEIKRNRKIEKLFGLFNQGGLFKFNIVQIKGFSDSKYNFQINDVNGFDNALNNLSNLNN